jgi:hypothetical protein
MCILPAAAASSRQAAVPQELSSCRPRFCCTGRLPDSQLRRAEKKPRAALRELFPDGTAPDVCIEAGKQGAASREACRVQAAGQRRQRQQRVGGSSDWWQHGISWHGEPAANSPQVLLKWLLIPFALAPAPLQSAHTLTHLCPACLRVLCCHSWLPLHKLLAALAGDGGQAGDRPLRDCERAD